MKDWKNMCRRFFYPPIWLILLLTVIRTVALVAVFVKGWDTSPMAYVVYMLSFYSLTVICIACYKTFPGYYKRIKGKVYENKYANRYITDVICFKKSTMVIMLSKRSGRKLHLRFSA